jgi:predicted NBD/HSP70 family sugar kinase
MAKRANGVGGRRKSSYVVGNQQVVKSINKTAILNIIRTSKSISRVALSETTKLSQSAISSIVGELIEEGFVREISPETSSGGRRPTLLKVTMTNRFLGAIALHSRATRVGILDLEGNILQKSSLRNTFTNPEEYLYACAFELNKLWTKFEGGELLAVGVTVPGLVNPKEGIVLRCISLGWRNMNVRYHLSQVMEADIILESEANACALAQFLYNTNPIEDSSFAYFTVNDDVGTGIVFNDSVLAPGDTSGFAFAHTSIDEHGDLCGCGNIGCLETYISNRALVQTYNELYSHHKEMRTPSIAANLGSITALHAAQVNEMVQLQWESTLQDVWYFNIYSSTDPNFETNIDNLVGSSAATSYLYRSVKPEEMRFYQVSAVDHDQRELIFSERKSFTVHKMAKIFSDDFTIDALDKYTCEGNINLKWEPGKAILGDQVNDQNDILLYRGDYGECVVTAKVKPTAVGIWDTLGVLAKVQDNENWYCGLIAYGVQLKEQHSLAFMRRKFGAKRGEHWIVFYPFSVELGNEYMLKIGVHKEILQLKAWPIQSEEPEDWQLTINDDTGWERGGVGFRHFGLGAEVNSLSVRESEEVTMASGTSMGNTLSDYENQATMIIAKALDGNDLALKAVKKVAKYIGIGISGVVNVFGMKWIAIASHYAQAWHILKPEIDKELHKRIIVFDPNAVRVLPLEVTEQLSLIAAGSLVAKEVFSGMRLDAGRSKRAS